MRREGRVMNKKGQSCAWKKSNQTNMTTWTGQQVSSKQASARIISGGCWLWERFRAGKISTWRIYHVRQSSWEKKKWCVFWLVKERGGFDISGLRGGATCRTVQMEHVWSLQSSSVQNRIWVSGWQWGRLWRNSQMKHGDIQPKMV